eukprot:PhM_4_TR2070/c1_g1_i1/m.47689
MVWLRPTNSTKLSDTPNDEEDRLTSGASSATLQNKAQSPSKRDGPKKWCRRASDADNPSSGSSRRRTSCFAALLREDKEGEVVGNRDLPSLRQRSASASSTATPPPLSSPCRRRRLYMSTPQRQTSPRDAAARSDASRARDTRERPPTRTTAPLPLLWVSSMKMLCIAMLLWATSCSCRYATARSTQRIMWHTVASGSGAAERRQWSSKSQPRRSVTTYTLRAVSTKACRRTKWLHDAASAPLTRSRCASRSSWRRCRGVSCALRAALMATGVRASALSVAGMIVSRSVEPFMWGISWCTMYRSSMLVMGVGCVRKIE